MTNEMYEDRFCKWQRWVNRNELENLAYPGVYVIAICADYLAGTSFSWRAEIIYIGMTNSEAGLRGRQQQFDHTQEDTRISSCLLCPRPVTAGEQLVVVG